MRRRSRVFGISDGHKFSRLDIPYPAKCVSDFADRTEIDGPSGRGGSETIASVDPSPEDVLLEQAAGTL